MGSFLSNLALLAGTSKNKSVLKNPYEEPYITPTMLHMENGLNKVLLNDIIAKSSLPADKDTYLLRSEYFNPIAEETGLDVSRHSFGGFATNGLDPMSFMDNPGVKKALYNAIVLNLTGNKDEDSILPFIYRHEYKHKNLPQISGPRNYGYVLPKDVQEFLNGYPEEDRGEELAAEIFAGRNMPQGLFNILRQKLNNESGYGYGD